MKRKPDLPFWMGSGYPGHWTFMLRNWAKRVRHWIYFDNLIDARQEISAINELVTVIIAIKCHVIFRKLA